MLIFHITIGQVSGASGLPSPCLPLHGSSSSEPSFNAETTRYMMAGQRVPPHSSAAVTHPGNAKR